MNSENGRRGRAGALVGLALLATTLVLTGASAPPPLPLRVVLPVAAAAPAPAGADFGCDERVDGSFTRSIGEDGDVELQHSLGDGARLCARLHGPARFDERTGAIRELPRGSSVLLETRSRQGGSQRMLVTSEGGERRQQWWLNGTEKPVDDAARAWLDDALEVVAAFREIGRIQGQVGGLQGEIGSIQGEVGALQGRIGQVQGEIGSLQGRVGQVQGERGGLQGRIGGHQGAIGGLQGARWNASASQEKQIDQEIRRHEAEIHELEAQLESGELTKRLADAEAQLAAFEKTAHARIAELEREIDQVRADDRIGALQEQIEDLHADDSIDEIKRRAAPALERLRARVRTFGS